MAECVTNYPHELPLGCVQQLVTIIRRGEMQPRAAEFAAAAWTVTGYCLRSFVGDARSVINGLPPAPAEVDAAARRQLEELSVLLSAVSVQPAGSQLSVFLRSAVVPVLAAALKKLLEAIAE